MKFFILPLFLVSLGGCSFLPSFGPSSSEILKSSNYQQSDDINIPKIELIDLDMNNMPKSQNNHPQFFSQALIEQSFLIEDQLVRHKDELVIRIWESSANGLFASQGNKETIFDVKVSNSGFISLPYIEKIQAYGESLNSLRKIILEKYQGKLVDPEILLSFKDKSSNTISLIQSNQSTQIEIPNRGVKLLEILAKTDAIQKPIWEMKVKINRNNLPISRVNLSSVLKESKNNIIILPGDLITLEHSDRSFQVFGAVKNPGISKVDQESVSLSRLIAQSGGLDDQLAETSSVFVFRNTNNKFTGYRVNFNDAYAFNLANQFEMQSSDLVFVGSADGAQFRKFMQVLFAPINSISSNL